MEEINLNFESKIWKKYLKIIQLNADQIDIKQEGDHVLIDEKFLIKPPKLQSIPERILELRKERVQKYYEYHNLYDNILNSNDDSAQIYRKEYQQVVDEINRIEDEIRRISGLLRSNMKFFQSQIDELISEEKRIDYRLGSVRETWGVDQPVPKNVLEDYMRDLLEKRHNQSEIYQKRLCEFPDYYIVELPVIPGHKPEGKSKVEKKYQHITAEQAREIKRSVKQLISETFRFKNLEQCLDRGVKTTYWMSKSKILEEIGKNDTLREKMPKGYKKLKREELCNSIEKLRERN